MSSAKYRITSPTLALFLEDGRHVARMIEEGTIVTNRRSQANVYIRSVLAVRLYSTTSFISGHRTSITALIRNSGLAMIEVWRIATSASCGKVPSKLLRVEPPTLPWRAKIMPEDSIILQNLFDFIRLPIAVGGEYDCISGPNYYNGGRSSLDLNKERRAPTYLRQNDRGSTTSYFYPETSEAVSNVRENDLDASYDGIRWFHLLGDVCLLGLQSE
jgi:hypothetical protein